ncbi:MAG: hypothetical protein C4532_03920 [Candidatus Abyssobacteria bacterium SURF_17]|uniref:Uncharacterized protein n=1 Tax=Candidatus Abyssobacteria bacterium SURF_17 TaxID=2093361 RepID=A0A419F5Q8_9BACT|nr:MAG: hypothetical protein C4532_03920 [Candidatus Abyssubacteria bacterium SURF_17]
MQHLVLHIGDESLCERRFGGGRPQDQPICQAEYEPVTQCEYEPCCGRHHESYEEPFGEGGPIPPNREGARFASREQALDAVAGEHARGKARREEDFDRIPELAQRWQNSIRKLVKRRVVAQSEHKTNHEHSREEESPSLPGRCNCNRNQNERQDAKIEAAHKRKAWRKEPPPVIEVLERIPEQIRHEEGQEPLRSK